MTPGRWSEVKAVLADVLDADPTERLSILYERCGADSELRSTVESLLAMESKADRLDTAALPGAALWGDVPSKPPAQIGPYTVENEIGRGGMGVVYLADRADGEYRKRVAIKLITAAHREMDQDRRFRRERQILAELEHPNIARLLDGGATNSGQPYIVMEYVEGAPLVAWCDEHRLNVEARVTLFLSVCDAVAHAHQKLIVHRDLKPGNILVTAAGVPKLLDFGLARMLDTDADAEITQAGPAPMTIAYASPEQIRGERQTVASDVYSLGVILYELLTAHRPYKTLNGSYAELVQVTCEQEPIQASRAEVSEEEAERRGTTPSLLSRGIAGDLETILLKALNKEPRLRYPTVDEFAADLRRHLQGEPIRARPATFSYRAQKFLRRHRVAAPAAALAIILILSFAGLSWFEARRAQRRFNDVEKLAHSVMFEFHDAIANIPGATAARELLVRRALEYLENLSKEAAGDPRLAREIALGYSRIAEVQGAGGSSNLGKTSAALENFQKAEQILSRLYARSPSDDSLRIDYLQAANGLARAYQANGDPAQAREWSRKNLDLAAAGVKAHPNDPKLLTALMVSTSTAADFLTYDQKYAEATPIRVEVLGLEQRIAALEPGNSTAQSNLALAYKRLGALYGVQKRYDEGRAQYEKARVIDEGLLNAHAGSSEQLALSYDYGDLGWITIRLNDYPVALDYYKQALALRQSVAGADPNDRRAAVGVASMTERLSGLLGRMGDLQEALKVGQEAIVLWKKEADRPGAAWSNTADLADTHDEVADIYIRMKAFQRAAGEYEETVMLYTSLKNRGVLPKVSFSHIDEIKAQEEKCRRSACGTLH